MVNLPLLEYYQATLEIAFIIVETLAIAGTFGAVFNFNVKAGPGRSAAWNATAHLLITTDYLWRYYNSMARARPFDPTEVINLYETIPSKYLLEGARYKNFEKIQIKVPFRMLIIGGSGSGKTLFTASLLRIFNCFSKIWLFARNLDEPIYRWMRDWFAEFEKKALKGRKRIFFYSNDISEIPEATDFDPTENNLVLLDDLINDKNLGKSNVANLFTMGRKNNVSVAFLSQSFFRVPMIIRQNATQIVLKKVASMKDFKRIVAEYSLDLDPTALASLYKKCVRTVKDHFIIDLEATDQNLKYRHNFRGIPMPDSED